MSQRLHIGATDKDFYDCVLTTPEGATEKLISDWLMWSDGFFVSPWKIRIGDLALWREVEPMIAEVINATGKRYPDDIWAFYYYEDTIHHPTANELQEWISQLKP